MEAFADSLTALIEIWQGEGERAIERLQARLEGTVKIGAGLAVPLVLIGLSIGELAAGQLEQAGNRLEALLALVEARDAQMTGWALLFLSDARRLLADEAAETAAQQAHALGEGIESRLLVGGARLRLGRLAASRGDLQTARQDALAGLDAFLEGGHLTWVPDCLDALAEVAAGLDAHEDAVRLLAAAERARAEMGTVRVPAEDDHWSSLESMLRQALGTDGYEAARAQGAEMTSNDAVEWARRARGPRKRPPGGWESLTPTEIKVAELVAEGLTNPQIGERMFISRATVKTHVAHIFNKLDVHSRTELGAIAALRRETDGSSPQAASPSTAPK
jgi:DNA-binding NarL/FixJ family response regulator